MAITYSNFQCVPAYDREKKLTGVVVYETQLWDGTETIFLFPSTPALSQQVASILKGKAVRIKAATLVITTLAGPLSFSGSIGTTSSAWNFLGPTFIGAQGDRIDLGLPDVKINFNWNDATPTNAFLAPGASTAPPNLSVTALSVYLEVVD
jgi:hypothetical protein